MKVEQVASIVNAMSNQFLGKNAIENLDLSNIVDIGTEILDATSMDNYVRSLVDHIGRVVFVDRAYTGTVPSVLMDAWEYGAVMEKITAEIPAASANESWDLKNGTTYNQDIFYKPVVSAKFFKDRVTFEIPISITEMQVRGSFSNATQLNAFLTMIYNAVEKGMTVRLNTLIKSTINNMIAGTLHGTHPDADYSATTHTRSVNLLRLYNDKFTKELDAEAAVTDPDFIRFASYTMSIYTDRLAEMSTLFNAGGKDRFTPRERLHIVMLSDFSKAAEVFLQADTFHDNLVKFPNFETIPYWQGSGTDYSFGSVSDIHVNIKDGDSTAEIVAGGILAVMFDRDALGVTNLDRRTTSHYNAKAEFTNNFHKMDAGYFNDFNENFVVFYVA